MLRKTPLRRKTALKRGSSQLKRSSLSRSSGKPSEKRERREAHLRRFKGQPCAVCNKTRWGNQKTTAHHILKAELWPEYYFDEENNIVLCPVHHVPFAHDKEADFLIWLQINHPDQWEWQNERRHHRRES